MLEKQDLLSLEEYAEKRSKIRHDTIQIKKLREVHLGEHIRLIFENRKTVQYQIQEMLRIEKIFESSEIQEELDVAMERARAARGGEGDRRSSPPPTAPAPEPTAFAAPPSTGAADLAAPPSAPAATPPSLEAEPPSVSEAEEVRPPNLEASAAAASEACDAACASKRSQPGVRFVKRLRGRMSHTAPTEQSWARSPRLTEFARLKEAVLRMEKSSREQLELEAETQRVFDFMRAEIGRIKQSIAALSGVVDEELASVRSDMGVLREEVARLIESARAENSSTASFLAESKEREKRNAEWVQQSFAAAGRPQGCGFPRILNS